MAAKKASRSCLTIWLKVMGGTTADFQLMIIQTKTLIRDVEIRMWDTISSTYFPELKLS